MEKKVITTREMQLERARIKVALDKKLKADPDYYPTDKEVEVMGGYGRKGNIPRAVRMTGGYIDPRAGRP